MSKPEMMICHKDHTVLVRNMKDGTFYVSCTYFKCSNNTSNTPRHDTEDKAIEWWNKNKKQ